MTKNKYSRVKKLEEKTSIGERYRVMPFCCFYIGDKAKTCDCKPYFTHTPRVIGIGMDTFYKWLSWAIVNPYQVMQSL